MTRQTASYLLRASRCGVGRRVATIADQAASMKRTTPAAARPAIVTLADLAPRLDVTGGSRQRVFGAATVADDGSHETERPQPGDATPLRKPRGAPRPDP